MRIAARSRPAARLLSAVLSAVLSGVLAVPAVFGAAEARAGDDAAPGAVAGVVFEPGPPPFADLLAKAKAEGKPIFIDFSTEWCGWCRRLERDTFAKPEVGEAMKAFVNVAFDAEQGEGVALAARYAARGFPTLLVVDAQGEEIDRIVGYRPPEAFLAEIARIVRGEGTLAALREAARKAPDDLSLALDLATRLSESRPQEALDLALTVEKASADAPETLARALGVRLAVLRETGDDAELVAVADRLLKSCAGSPAAGAAAEVLLLRAVPRGRGADVEPALAYAASLRARLKDGKFPAGLERLLARLHRTAAEQALARALADADDDPMALNEAAWTMYLMRGDTRKAITWARRAVELSKRDPAMLDTLACLLAETGAFDEAIALEEEALAAVQDESMRRDFVENVAKWKAVRDVRKAGGARRSTAVPAAPVVAPEAGPAGGK